MEPTVKWNDLDRVIGSNTEYWNTQSEVNPNWWWNPRYAGTMDEWACMHGKKIGQCPGVETEFCGEGPDDGRYTQIPPEEVDAAVAGLLKLLS